MKLYKTPTPWHTDGDTYNAQVRWKSLNTNGQGVDYFTIKLENEMKNVLGKHYITAANASRSGSTEYEVSFDNVKRLAGDLCFVSVQASSRLGQSREVLLRLQRSHNESVDTETRHLFYYPLWATVMLFGLLAFCAALVVGRRLRRRAAAGSDRVSKGGASADGYDMVMLKGLDDVDVLLDDNAVIVSDVILGHGHFGVVRKGTLKTDDGRLCSVAIKSLRDRPSGRDRDEFLREILLMQKVGKHQNIVSMIGCCLDANRRCMLVVEYCQLGDLQTYLRKVRLLNDTSIDVSTLTICVSFSIHHIIMGDTQFRTIYLFTYLIPQILVIQMIFLFNPNVKVINNYKI